MMGKLARGTVLISAVGSATFYAAVETKNLWNENEISEKIGATFSPYIDQLGQLPQNSAATLTVAKKSWNSGVISSCQYLQEKCDLKQISRSIVNKVQETYHNSIDELSATKTGAEQSSGQNSGQSSDYPKE